MNFNVVLVGAGNMGGAMLRGWIANGLSAANITVIDPSPSEEMATFLRESTITVCADANGVKPPDVLVVAIKPQMMEAVLPSLRSLAGTDTVVVSVAAGTTISSLAEGLQTSCVVRSMPNTPSLVGRGISVACPAPSVNDAQKQQVDSLLRATGKLEWVGEEALMDAVTAVSGSGPAYVFHLAECMAKAGVAAGLPADLAMSLACETVSGAGELLRLSDDEPAALRQKVTSPGGTTAAALQVMMAEDGMPGIIEEGILAAKKRSEELS